MTDGNQRFDLFVVGAGSGGVRAARFAASLGAKVAIAEDRLFGGTCVHVGCVPKKLLVYGASYSDELDDARRFGWDLEVKGHSWETLRDATGNETSRLGGIYRRMLESSGVTVFHERASLAGPNAVRLGDRTIEAERILIATGSRADRLDVPGKELGITSDDAFTLSALPRSLTILGAGYIGLEFAGIFSKLGVAVTVALRGEKVLRGFDEDVRKHVMEEMTKQGVVFAAGREFRAIVKRGDSIVVETAQGELVAEQVMHCVGRSANTPSLGLEKLGVATRPDGSIVVDENYESNVASVLAVGDVIGGMQLTPVALAEGMFVARNLFAKSEPAPVDYRFVPTAVFCQPNVATVGQSETQAREAGPVRIFRTTFKPMRHSVSGRDAKMLMKLVVDATTDRVLGAHIVGPDAAEIIQGFAVAMTCGATKAQLDSTIGLHPTAAEELVTMRTEAS